MMLEIIRFVNRASLAIIASVNRARGILVVTIVYRQMMASSVNHALMMSSLPANGANVPLGKMIFTVCMLAGDAVNKAGANRA